MSVSALAFEKTKNDSETNNSIFNINNDLTNNKINFNSNYIDQHFFELMNKIDDNEENNIYYINTINEKLVDFSQEEINNFLSKTFISYVEKQNKTKLDIIRSLLSQGADINIKINYNFFPENEKITLLMFSCFSGDFDLFNILINNEKLLLNEESIENNGKNCLFFIFEHYEKDKTKIKNIKRKMVSNILLKNKNNQKEKNNFIYLNKLHKDSGKSLLMLSIINNDLEMTKIFLDYDSDVNLQDSSNGNTALHYAILQEDTKIVEYLLNDLSKITCNLQIKNKNNETPFDLAEIKGNKSITNLILSKLSVNDIDINENLLELKNIEELNSFLEIPFFLSIDSNEINNNNQKIMENLKVKSNKNKNNRNNSNNIDIIFKETPTLTINLDSEEEEDQLILDSLIEENNQLSKELISEEEKIRNIIENNFDSKKKLLKINTELTQLTNKLTNTKKEFNEFDITNVKEMNTLQYEKKKAQNTLDALYQKKYIKINKKLHDILIYNEKYLSKKFDDKIYDDISIKVNLTKDILDFYYFNKTQINKMQQIIKDVIISIKQILKNNNLDYEIIIGGSYSNNISLPSSTLDLNLVHKSSYINNSTLSLIYPSSTEKSNEEEITLRNNAIEELKTIEKILKNINWISQIFIVNNYLFPFITLFLGQKFFFLKVNISIEYEKNYQIKHSQLTNHFLKTFKSLEPLILVMKQLIRYCNQLFSLSDCLDKENNSKLNSFCITLMIIHFLQYQISSCSYSLEMLNDPNNLGDLFLKLILYYGGFDNKNYILIATGINDKIEQKDLKYIINEEPELIFIDPLNHSNNVSKTFLSLNILKIVFLYCYYSTKKKCDCSCHYLNLHDNIEEKLNLNYINYSNEINVEHCMLKKIFKTAIRMSTNFK